MQFPTPVPSDDYIAMSIQTHPSIAAWSFAETAILISSKKIVYPLCLGYYDDVLRHDEPEDLYKHIEKVAALISNVETFNSILK